MAFSASEKIRAATLNDYIASGDYSTYAEYAMSGNQTIGNNVYPNVIIAFGYQNRASPLVTQTVDGAGHRFTLNRAGLWAVTTTIRWASDVAGSERFVSLDSSLANSGAGAQADSYLTATGPPTENISVCRYYPAGAWVRMAAWQGSGADRALEANNNTGWGRINLAWIHA